MHPPLASGCPQYYNRYENRRQQAAMLYITAVYRLLGSFRDSESVIVKDKPCWHAAAVACVLLHDMHNMRYYNSIYTLSTVTVTFDIEFRANACHLLQPSYTV
eukprot:TRINITY_DN3908_c0_g3_i1.p1 TRINITY_DN3908_c0_g3~~TRINITY_DN3908_c0_g3_i1.p1  ORF type:complete len:103 (+),score=3.31 TRINITY_DN3908_c0_g3_i1:706-1014(+)